MPSLLEDSLVLELLEELDSELLSELELLELDELLEELELTPASTLLELEEDSEVELEDELGLLSELLELADVLESLLDELLLEELEENSTSGIEKKAFPDTITAPPGNLGLFLKNITQVSKGVIRTT